jgi:hypothetical protein
MTQMLENLRKGSAAHPKLQAQLDAEMLRKAREDAYTPTIKEDAWPNTASMGRLGPKGSGERRREMLRKYRKQQAQQSSIARQMAAPLGSALSANTGSALIKRMTRRRRRQIHKRMTRRRRRQIHKRMTRRRRRQIQ